MTITIECTHCGTQFAAEPDFAGRRIRCTRCREVFRVPADVAATASGEVSTATLAGSAPSVDEPFNEWNVPEDFEYSLQSDGQEENACPYCHTRVEPNQVLCTQCGYHLKLKKKIETTHGEEEPEKPQTIQEVILSAQIDFGIFSIPAWPVGAGAAAFAFVTFVIYLFVPVAAALLLLAVGLGLWAVGNFWIIVIAFHESALMALAVWFVPFFWWYYVITRFEDLWVPLSIAFAGFLMLVAGLSIIGSDSSFDSAALAMAWVDLKAR